MPTLYRNESSDHKRNAQRNLCGRTHYVDDDTLRFHKSRVLAAGDTSNGLLFWIITSDALDMHNRRRGFRFVVFDVFGNVLARPKLEESFKTSAQARKAMWVYINGLDVGEVTRAAIAQFKAEHARVLSRIEGDMTDALKRGATA